VKNRAIPLIWLAGLLWVVVEVVGGRVGGQSPFEIVWFRYVVQTLAVLVLVAPRRRGIVLRSERPLLQGARGLLMFGMPVSFLLAATLLPPEQVWGIFWVAPLLVLALAPGLLGERVDRRTWAVALVAFGGALISTGVRFSPPDLAPRLAWLLPIAMAACFALYVIATRGLRHEPLATGLIYTGVGVIVPFSLLLARTWRTPSPRDGLLMAAIGFLGLAFLWALDRALEQRTASELAPHCYAQVVWMAVVHALGALSVGAALDGQALVGAVVVAAVLTAPAIGALRWPFRSGAAPAHGGQQRG
jgi:drug/metabolite transporter (DMT)-like permease